MQIGDRVIWIANDPALSPMEKRVFEGTVTKLGKETVYVDNHHKAEDQLYTSFVWPDVPVTRALCNDILEMEKRHKQEDKDMMRRIMLTRNVVREL